ncbi:MAG: KaiC domain-containing protein [Methanomassiliicoccales archaeon]|nr:KaiC domain-containing protein [Methanomassiliicoccales archaeon]NYT15430.1 KaiC domain-containing protein [Methanomassiliicoccales archaeon]
MERVKTGISGLDEMLGGGFPKSHNIVVMGSFGTGKTTFGLQFLFQGIKEGDKGIFITLEEDEESIIMDGQSFGWDLRPAVEGEQLVIVKLEPTDALSTISRIKSDLPKFIKSFGASRIVIDSISLLNMLFETEHEKRANLFALTQMIKETNATCLMTAEVNDKNPNASRDGLVEYTADGVVVLQYEEPEDKGEILLTLRVVKMRRTDHSRRIRPYSIGDGGILVHTGAEVF